MAYARDLSRLRVAHRGTVRKFIPRALRVLPEVWNRQAGSDLSQHFVWQVLVGYGHATSNCQSRCVLVEAVDLVEV